MDVGGTTTAAGLVMPQGEMLAHSQAPTHAEGAGTALRTLFDLADGLVATAKAQGITLLGLGVGVPGVVDAERGVVGEDIKNVPELARCPLAEQLASRYGLRAWVDNDVNLLALGQWRFGVGRGARSLVLLALGTGVGGGIILDGHLVRGAGGYGGELGCLPINFDTPRASAFGRGWLDSYVSGREIAETARQRLPDLGADVTAATVFQAARDGHAGARALVEEVCQALGAGLAIIVNALNPEVVLVTGGVAESLIPMESAVLRWVSEYAFRRALVTTRITFLSLDKRATVLGGAALYLYETGGKA
ncbi:MAG: ROK family protein [Candidatus Rokubacteria bacterium]|nr:ROK family protein [Candidatus Rokubacteria bacterium]MBI2554138.1 ROK family protein [Candidatus Rokubacteria bacterium]